jgi:hypothetical protein
MASSQTFKSVGYFDREIDLTSQTQTPIGVPAGVVGAAEKGPAFVPITVGSFADFRTKFGNLNPRFVAPYSVEKFLNNRTALTFIRVLGAGSNENTTDFDNTRTKGIVKNAGFALSSSQVQNGAVGSVQFLVARHIVTASEAFGYPIFTNNSSYFTTGSTEEAYLVRGVIFAASDAKIMVLSHNESFSHIADSLATPSSSADRTFKIVVSSSVGSTFSTTDGFSGVKIFTASLDPASDNYFAKVLNTDPEQFGTEKHLVYADFAIDSAIAQVGTGSNNVMIASGSSNTSTVSGDTSLAFRQAFGRYDTRYTTPKTTKFISQPFGDKEYDLFHFESIDDGAYANVKYKISITNLQKSTNPRDTFGTFSVSVRAFDDTDVEPQIIEQFNDLNLNPESDNYIAKMIGDKKAFFNFDVEGDDDRRLIVQGKNVNKSKYIRVIMDEVVENKQVPDSSLPFGFRGPEVLKTNSLLTDGTGSGGFSTLQRFSVSGSPDPRMLAAIIPPMPYRFKVTRGEVSTEAGFIGAPGSLEIADSRYYWGVNLAKVSNVLNPNITTEQSNLVPSITKFLGIGKLDVLVTGSSTDTFNSNKFTLARVAFGNTTLTDITGSVSSHMREASYIRNGRPDVTNYTITDDSLGRITFATLLQKASSSADFNKFSAYAKFTNVMYGGWDGTNILDKNAATLNDRASSKESRDSTYGNSNASFSSPGFGTNQNGVGLANCTIFGYRTAANIITDAVASNVNIIAVPGQREPFVTDHFADKARDYGMALYTMDVPNYNSDGSRIFDGETGQYVDIEQTADALESRAYDNYFAASYFPNIVMDDSDNNRRVTVPGSVAAVAALGFNDKVAYPWFAPAGFNRASLAFVTRTEVRIKQSERERLESVKINPIVKFPSEPSYVIFAQNTLQATESALSSINVQRMVSEVKRQVVEIANKLIFDNISSTMRAGFVKDVSNSLSVVQARSGIERFKVICNDTNNTSDDENNNQMNGKIVIIPTRSIEHIAVDFIITPSGVSFTS